MNIFLTVLGSLVLGGLVGAYLAWRPLNNALLVARTERRNAQRELAGRIAYCDRWMAARDAEKATDDREYNELWEHAERLAADLTAAWETCTVQAELIRERGMHDEAAAAAVEAEIVDPFADLPSFAAVAALCPVSPAPVVTFDAPTGSWAFAGVRAAIESGVPA